MKLQIIFIMYGLLYPYFENWFNWIQMDLFDKKKTWQEKLQFKPSNPASQWHSISGGVCGTLLFILFLIPFDMTNIFIIILACLIGSIIITAAEFGMGYFLFYVLKIKRFWDYSNSKINLFGKEIPLNYLGLIDIFHSLAWMGLTYLFFLINKYLFLF
jgi:hypothetical protein